MKGVDRVIKDVYSVHGGIYRCGPFGYDEAMHVCQLYLRVAVDLLHWQTMCQAIM